MNLIRIAPDAECDEAALEVYATQLAAMLNDDSALLATMGPASGRLTAGEVLAEVNDWCARNRALNFAMVLEGGLVIGNISLSHMDFEAGLANCGFFLTSAYWGQGYGTRALSLMTGIARQRGFRQLRGKLRKDGPKGCWERNGAVFEQSERETHWQAVIDLENKYQSDSVVESGASGRKAGPLP